MDAVHRLNGSGVLTFNKKSILRYSRPHPEKMFVEEENYKLKE